MEEEGRAQRRCEVYQELLDSRTERARGRSSQALSLRTGGRRSRLQVIDFFDTSPTSFPSLSCSPSRVRVRVRRRTRHSAAFSPQVSAPVRRMA